MYLAIYICVYLCIYVYMHVYMQHKFYVSYFFLYMYIFHEYIIYIKNIYGDRLKSSSADQDTVMECDQMNFIFWHSPLYSQHTFSISVADLGSSW